MQRELGHKRFANTEKYIQLEQVYFREEKRQYVVKEARTGEEIKRLLELGYELADQSEGVKYYRIPKEYSGTEEGNGGPEEI